MRKIPTVYLRDEADRSKVTDQVNPGCEWVLAGEGRATRKWDGTCVLIDSDGHAYARREVKPSKTPPPEFREVETDQTTGKTVGWEPAAQSGFAKYIAEALAEDGATFPPGTYELCGPKVQGNPDGWQQHCLVPHGNYDYAGAETDPMAIVREVAALGWEGIVWHHPDGRMAKLKARDLR